MDSVVASFLGNKIQENNNLFFATQIHTALKRGSSTTL